MPKQPNARTDVRVLIPRCRSTPPLLTEEIEGIIAHSADFAIPTAGLVTAELDAMTGVISTSDLNHLR